ncbi:MAG TPA: type 1 glutamine amidotransferase domain-containing protein [Gammaproteobacteria bacterium]|nr:type 1 glutamine amidotransferase domain-containing protein [Gammaproteobacteria bacterium]
MNELQGKKVAILVANGFEQSELEKPKKALEEAGAVAHIVSPEEKEVKGWQHTEWGDSFAVDVTLDAANAADYDALMLPGGQMNPDNLRLQPKAIEFAKRFFQDAKPVAAICHGPWLLVETGAIKGKTMTSWPTLKSDLTNAGANWVDEEVVTDGGLVTSRKPDDIPAFNRKMIEEFAEGRHKQQQVA